MNVVFSDGAITLLHGDCRVELADLEPDSIDSCVTDPPYELSSDGKASAARVVAEVMFPQHRKRPAGVSGECHLGFLATKVAELCGIGVVPGPAAAVPVGAVALDEESPGGDGDVEHGGPPSGGGVAEPERRLDPEPQVTEHLGSFLLELADVESGVNALNRAGTSFDAGGFRVGLGIAPSSLGALARSGGSVPLGDDVVRALDDTLTALVGAGGGAEELAVSYPLLTRGADEDRFTAGGALTFLALAKASAAQLVSAVAGTGLVPSGAEPRRIRVVGPMADRAFTFDLFLHAHLAEVTSTGFMGAEWDGSKVAYDIATWRAVYRVLKPGAHLIVFGAPRTWHRVAVAVEDAGFEIRDTILAWANGEGFPKSLNVSKAIDKAAGQRTVVGVARGASTSNTASLGVYNPEYEQTVPATEAAAQWDGWGTALKPAIEPILLARKPLVGTVVANVLAHGTGAMNIDACRIAAGGDSLGGGANTAMTSDTRQEGWTRPWMDDDTQRDAAAERSRQATARAEELGRWPANLVLVHDPACRPTDTVTDVRTTTHYPAARGAGGIGQDGHKGQDGLTERSPGTEPVVEWACAEGCPVAALDAQTGERASTGAPGRPARPGIATSGGYTGGDIGDGVQGPLYSDTGGASRFYARFAHAIDEEFAAAIDAQVMADGPIRYMAKASQRERPEYVDGTGTVVQHSTVKPLDLVRYLVRLITPPGGRCLDPFTGSGTTPEACVLEGARFIGCELTARYLPLIEQRIARGYRGGPAYPDPVPGRPKPDTGVMSLFDDL